MNIIETARLYLRNFMEDDFVAVHEYASLADFSQYDVWGPNAEEDTKTFINQAILSANAQPRLKYDLAIILKNSNELIGGARIGIDEQINKIASIGYGINPRFQNLGYATEVSQSLVKFSFEELGLLMLYATCDVRNTVSARVLEKAGMVRVRTMIGNKIVRGVKRDSYRYEISSYTANF